MSPFRRPLLALLATTLGAALVLTLFAWPAANLEPRELPIGVVGDRAVERSLAARGGAYEIHRYPDARAARQAIRDRHVYGAFVTGDSGPQVATTLFTAPAAGPAVSRLLAREPVTGGRPVRAVEVVPAARADPNGSGLAASLLPLAITGMLVGVASSRIAPAGRPRAAFLAAGAILAGLAGTTVIGEWMGIVAGDRTDTWAALTLVVLAIGSVVAGLAALLGPPGIALGAAIMVLVGNATSAVTSAPEMLPQPMGAIGQLLPPGAGATLIRSTAFFDGAAAGGPIIVLLAWALAGAGLQLAAVVRRRRQLAAGLTAGGRAPVARATRRAAGVRPR